MSNYIKIFVDGQLVDLPEGFTSLRLTYALKDRRGLAINTGSRSEYSFQFPATKQNDAIFDAFWEVGRQNEDRQKFLPAAIDVDGLPYFQGKSQLTSVTTQDNQYYWKGLKYKVAFYGNNADWVQDIRDKRLKDYPIVTHIFNNASIINGWQQQYPADDWGYTLIKWKDWAFPNKVQFQESTPFIFVAAFVRNIFNDIGYTVESNFISLDFFERLIMPIPLPDKFDNGFSDDYLTIEADEPTFLLSTNVLGNPSILSNQTTAPNIGANPYNTGTGAYTVPYDGFYKFEYEASITNVTGTGVGLSIYIQEVGGLAFFETQIGVTGSAAYTSNATLRGEYVLQLTAGQTVGLGHLGFTAGTGDADIALSMKIVGEIPVKTGTLIDFKYLIPAEWRSLDLLKGLAHAFNLVFQTNPITRTVQIEPADSYAYKSDIPSVSTIEEGFYNAKEDLTQKIDLLREGELKSNTDEPVSYVLGWQVDGATEEAINERQDLGFLQGRYNFPVGRYAKAEKVIENPFFASTLCILDQAVTHENSNAFCQIPLIWSKNYLEEPTSVEANYEVKPRLLIKQPQVPISERAFVRVDNGAGYSQILCPLAYMVDYNNLSGERMSLAFGNNTINGNEIKGLLDRHYLSEMKRREVGKDLETYLFWDLLGIQNLDFRNKVILKDDAYILQEINSFNVLSDKSTKTYLQYAAQVESSDSDKVDSPTVDNKIVSG
jgi:hypothetical protein